MAGRSSCSVSYTHLNPTFPFYYKLEEENEIINAYRADLDTYFSENLVAFVMGTRSLDEWDAYAVSYTHLNWTRIFRFGGRSPR